MSGGGAKRPPRQARERREAGEAPVAGERLQKILARAGVASRREAEAWIQAGRVTVNGRVAHLGERASADDDAIKVDGKLLRPLSQHRYLLLNKPDGYVTTRRDELGRPTALDLVPAGYRRALVPVGRLDFHTEGLLILTTDGELSQLVSHPRHGCKKTYEVKVRGKPERAVIERLQQGIRVAGRQTAPCRVRTMAPPKGGRDATENSWWRVELSEGRTRQIREMFRQVGHPVQRLRRVAIGPLRDARLPVGAWRELDPEEVESLRRGSRAKRTPSGRGKAKPSRGAGAPKGGPPQAGRQRKKARAAPPGRRGRGS